MSGIALATEDELSEQVGLILAAEARLDVELRFRRGGNGYLQSRISNFCEMVSFQPVLVISDLDRQRCASQLVAKWLGARVRPANLLIRIAVREIEAWLLADHEAMGGLLGRRAGLPREPDALLDPKQSLLNLARRAPKRVREELLPLGGALASQGLGYNALLGEFVRTAWSPTRAALLSPSLRRARRRLNELERRIG